MPEPITNYMRKNQITFSIAVAATIFGLAARADDLEQLAGKWSVKKTSEQGQSYTQTMAVNKDKFTFEMLDADRQVVIHAEGQIKVEKLGPFSVVHSTNIRGGSSADNMQEISEEYHSIYKLEGDTWTMAANFDSAHMGQKPSINVYERVKESASSGTLVIDEIEMADTPQTSTWFICLEATVNGVTQKYNISGKEYDKNQVTIPLALELPKAKAGEKCSFKVQLDDVEPDVCTDEIDNRSVGEFTISAKGEQSYKPEDHWRYTVRWHMK